VDLRARRFACCGSGVRIQGVERRLAPLPAHSAGGCCIASSQRFASAQSTKLPASAHLEVRARLVPSCVDKWSYYAPANKPTRHKRLVKVHPV
jgi:hypothetical protein